MNETFDIKPVMCYWEPNKYFWTHEILQSLVEEGLHNQNEDELDFR